MLWLTGKPGSGKSTLLKNALLKEIELHDNLTVSFFFYKSNSNEHTTSLNLYRCLLGQLIGGCQERRWYQLTDTIKQLIVNRSEQEKDNNEWIWHPDELSRFLRDCGRKVVEKCAVQIFVDALDECDIADQGILEKFFSRRCNQIVHQHRRG